MTHKDEICYWAKQPDGTMVWFKYGNNDWKLTSGPVWRAHTKYIVDNEWAELRKAQADGKQLQIETKSGWKFKKLTLDQVRLHKSHWWRIKPEEPVYEWQWIYKVENGSYSMTINFYKNIDELFDAAPALKRTPLPSRFELSKRERK